jgi:hypothetical protein
MKKDAIANKELIVFDLDGTLTPSKSNLEPDMSRALIELLARKKVAVISGGSYQQFKKQFLKSLACPKDLLSELFLFPTNATAFYRYQNGWKNIYWLKLSRRDREETIRAFRDVFREIGYVPPKKIYGRTIEDRGSQITFSALGQDVVAKLGRKGLALKEQWRRENTPLKLEMSRLLAKKLPRLEVRPSAFTSIDITRHGIDKAYGIRQIKKYLHIPVQKMVFIGDALYRGGNDAAARRTGVMCVAVHGPDDTKRIIEKILKTD